jgi:tRNA pseudouridine55 synthase
VTHDGIINLFKPLGITSAGAIYRIRSTSGIKKSGHAGSLDPAADGVLLICQGRATKLVERIMDLPKVYRATARLDVTSSSFDSDRSLVEVDVPNPPGPETVASALARFQGELQQVPPRISAVKLNGVPAYKTAGSENAPPIRPRSVHIYWTHLHAYDWPNIEFEMACGRGTYVRALIRDLGETLGTGGCLTSLHRSAVGAFTSDEAKTLDDVTAAGVDQEQYLTPIEQAVELIEGSRNTIPPAPVV